ncbi:hypothetical protein [Streptomyces sp. KL116D]|uniref:hypothetical protein n=1 Tax=Streptomyces sp. KL116D TaxID=3045152 RepID=UPI0035571819
MGSLANTVDLADRLGRPLTGPEEARAIALLDDASALVVGFTGRTFTSTNDDVVVLRAQHGEIRLPQTPVINVTSVIAVGAGGAPDLPVAGWQWDGIDIVRTSTDSPAINLPERWYDEDNEAYPGTYRVTYSHGTPQVPGDVVAIVARMVLRTLTSPTMAGGVTGETIGPYSYRTDGSGIGTAVTMTDDDRRMLELAGYRRKAGMTTVRWR